MTRLLPLLLILLLSPLAYAAQSAGGDILPPEQAFPASAQALNAGAVAVHWKVTPGYYLYADKFAFASDTGGVALGKPKIPPGTIENDQFLGRVEIFTQGLTVRLPVTRASSGARELILKVTAQGCKKNAICYPPFTQTLRVTLPKAAAATANASPLAALTGDTGGNQFLPPDQAFKLSLQSAGPGRLIAHWDIAHGYHLYRDEIKFSLKNTPGLSLGKIRMPKGETVDDAFLGRQIVYAKPTDVAVPIERAAGSAGTGTLTVRYQGCADKGICYPPITKNIAFTLSAAKTPPASGDASAAALQPPAAEGPVGSGAAPRSLLTVLLLALAGGLLLNLMPCVLPVLSLKAVSLIEARESAKKTHHHALAYTAGVLLSFAVAGLAVIALRQAGMASGWGFQLQQPVFVATLVYILLAMGLSYSGVVHFGAGLAGTGQTLTAKSGLAGDFFTGVLAVVVASPCTAPAMGAALAFAFAAPWYSALLVFLMLGFGLALPFLLIGYFPKLGSWLPKPGAWMETLKQVLAFPLYLTAAWLAWVLANQLGADGIGLLLVGAVLLALALWWSERSRYRGVPSKILAGVLVLLALAPLALIHGMPTVKSGAGHEAGVVAFTPARLAELRRKGTPVFVDMSADWCITCKVNERAVLNTAAFHALIKRTGMVYMIGDWTNENPAISAFLKRWHSPGVPVYVVFPKGGGAGTKLPSVLTPGLVRAAVENASR